MPIMNITGVITSNIQMDTEITAKIAMLIQPIHLAIASTIIINQESFIGAIKNHHNL